MSKAIDSDPDLATLQADIAALKRDVGSLIGGLKAGSANGATNADGASEFYRNLATEGERSMKAIGRQVEKQPVVAVLIALGIGYIGGRLLSR